MSMSERGIKSDNLIPFRKLGSGTPAYSSEAAVRKEASALQRRQTARELEEERIREERRRRFEKNVRKHAIIREINQSYQRENGHTRRELMLIAGACALILSACAFFIWQESGLSRTARRVNALQTQYAELLSENNALSGEIGKNINVEKIYRYAVDELKMSYPDKAHIMTFNHLSKNNVRQEEEIPLPVTN